MKDGLLAGLVLLLLISCLPGPPPAPLEEITPSPAPEIPMENVSTLPSPQFTTPPGGHLNQDLPVKPTTSSSPLPTISTPTSDYRPPQGATVLYNQDQVIFEHYWPNTASLKGDESEILVYNEGTAPVQITASDQIFILGNQRYSQYSGTWEKFPSRQSWNRIDYVNINQNYYTGQPLILEPGQKGKLHWHYQFKGDVSTQQQAAEITIAFTRQGKSYSLDKKLAREETLPYPSSSSASSSNGDHKDEGENMAPEKR